MTHVIPESRPDHAAFTLLELLAVVLVVLLLALTALPTLARTRSNASAIQCLNNQRRLTVAWQMYASDNQDRLVSPADWVEEWLDWSMASGNTNTAILEDPESSLIARHVRSAVLFKCPADQYVSNSQLSYGWKQRARSVALSSSLGGVSVVLYYEIPGREFFVARQLSQLNRPGPANTVTILDEHPDSINNGMFSFDPGLAIPNARWRDLPASYHQAGAGVAFADGHAMIKRWQDVRTIPPVRYVTWLPVYSPGNSDCAWMNDHVPYR